MLVNEALRRLRFNTGTLSDVTGKSANQLFTNQAILDQLQTQLDSYANITKAIEDTYSFGFNKSTPFIKAPDLALRSEAYKFILVIIQGRYFPADMASFAQAYNNFPIRNVSGITNWFLPWGHKGSESFLFAFPMISTNPNATTLTSAIAATDTTIPVASTAGMITNEGRITIGNEKILYSYVDTTHFYGCQRGVEGTTAVNHLNSTAVTENNVFLFYSRRHTNIQIAHPDIIPASILNFTIEVNDEHMEGILKATTFDLMLKVDREKAADFKVDAEKLYAQYRIDIRKGRSRISQGN